MVEQTSLVVQLGRNSLPSWGIHYHAHAFSIGFTRLGEDLCVSFRARAHTRTVVAAQSVRFLFFVQAMYRADDGPGKFTVWSSWRYSSRCFVLCSSGVGLESWARAGSPGARGASQWSCQVEAAARPRSHCRVESAPDRLGAGSLPWTRPRQTTLEASCQTRAGQSLRLSHLG